jgi:hypothetical protein
MGRDHLVINDFDNEFLNKYERNIKSRKKIMNMFHQKQLNNNHCKLYKILIILDEVSIDNEII